MMTNFSSVAAGEFAIDDPDGDDLAGFLNGTAIVDENGTSAPDLEELTIQKVKRITTGIAIPILYFFLVIFGVLGNAVVIYVSFFLTKRSKNAVDIFVGNLAVADLALITTLPFWAVANILSGRWIFGDALCKIMSFLTHINMSSSIFLITAMAVDRYTVVVKAVKVRAKSLRTVRRTLCSCAIIWIFSALLSLPAAILREARGLGNATYCSWHYPPNSAEVWWALHIVTRNVIGFVIPLTIICRCYCVIVSYVRTRSSSKPSTVGTKSLRPSDEAKEKQAQHVTRLVTAIILAFVICWLPNQLSNFSHSLIHFKAIPTPSTFYGREAMYLIHVFTTVLSFCNSVINPVIYSTSPSHRRHIKMLFYRVCWCSKKGRDYEQTMGESGAAENNGHDHTLNTPKPSNPQGQSPDTKSRRFTEVTRLAPSLSPCMTNRTSMTSLTSRNGAIDTRDENNSNNRGRNCLPTGAEDQEQIMEWRPAPVIVVNDYTDITAPDDNDNSYTSLLSNKRETIGNDYGINENEINESTL